MLLPELNNGSCMSIRDTMNGLQLSLSGLVDVQGLHTPSSHFDNMTNNQQNSVLRTEQDEQRVEISTSGHSSNLKNTNRTPRMLQLYGYLTKDIGHQTQVAT